MGNSTENRSITLFLGQENKGKGAKKEITYRKRIFFYISFK